MPYLQVMTERANIAFGRMESIEAIEMDLFASAGSLIDAAKALRIAVSDTEIAYLESWPAGQLEALRAALFSALNREPRLPVTFAWAPGYDFELTIWEAAGIPESRGGMTILMRSRYPDDTHPAS